VVVSFEALLLFVKLKHTCVKRVVTIQTRAFNSSSSSSNLFSYVFFCVCVWFLTGGGVVEEPKMQAMSETRVKKLMNDFDDDTLKCECCHIFFIRIYI